MMKSLRQGVLSLAVSLAVLTTVVSSSPVSGHSAGVKSISTTIAQDERVFTNEAAGIQIERPAGWKAEPSGEVLTLTSADSAISIVFWVVADESFDEATGALDKELDKIIKHVKVTDAAKEDTLNGFHTVTESGTGEVDGTTIEWSVDIIKAKKPVIILWFAGPDAVEKHKGEIVKFIRSIKKVDE